MADSNHTQNLEGRLRTVDVFSPASAIQEGTRRTEGQMQSESFIGFIPTGRPSARAEKPSSGASDQVLLLA